MGLEMIGQQEYLKHPSKVRGGRQTAESVFGISKPDERYELYETSKWKQRFIPQPTPTPKTPDQTPPTPHPTYD
jgi:hypothetical protein